MPEGERDPDGKHADNQRVEPGIVEKGNPNLLVEHHRDQRAQGQEHHHPDKKDPGRRQLKWVDVLRHGD